tara:strand:- start:553 stop:960 length:408 start_codon:yes stop_codon:yes gene_type:complete
MKITLRNSKDAVLQLRQLWDKIKTSLDGGSALVVDVRLESRSIEQNSMFHSIISQIAVQAEHAGGKWDAESWKRLLVDAYFAEKGERVGRVVPNLTGDGIVQLGEQTRKFNKLQASEFTEFCLAWAAISGVTIND